MTHHSLKFAPSILARLGEELLPNFDQGIIELVKNAYDADARTCIVKLENITKEGGSITIEDTGHGMDDQKIATSWLVLGHSSKRGAATTPKGRIQVGDKGLGRLSALRMGNYVILKSRPELADLDNANNDKKKADTEHQVALDWCKFDSCSTVDEITVDVLSTKLTEISPAGTIIHIQNLKQKITKTEVERLARSLMLLSNPFEETNDFKLSFICPEYPELEKLVHEGYLNEAEFVLKAKLNNDGRAEAEVFDWRNNLLWKTNSVDWFVNKSKDKNLDPIYKAPPSQFELNIYHLDDNTFATRSVNKRKVSAWLKSVGGVHIYHNDFRVHPYGDKDSDWLGMNLARVNNPSIRPSTNTSIGRLNITDVDKLLQQKTDRVGFIENHTFFELKRFVTDALDWYAAERAAWAAKLRKAQKDENELQVRNKEKALKEEIDKILDPKVKQALNKAFMASKAASNQQTKHLKQDLKLYRSLATTGTITTVFSHEVSKPISEIPESLSRADRVVKQNTTPAIYAQYKERASNILGYLSRLSHFAELQLDLLKRNKRRNEAIDVISVITELLRSFTPLLEREHIQVSFVHKNDFKPKLQGAICILEAIITNCLTNSLRAFRTENFDVDTRKIEILLLQEVKESIVIRFSDNGPGITELSLRDIWLPGVTTTENGTGFGLTIVKDSVADLGGNCRVDAHGPLGGATFYFEFTTI